MRPLLFALSLLFALATARAAVVRPEPTVIRLAPDFTFPGVGKAQSLKGVRGQPVVLIVTKSPKIGDFKAQVKKLNELYLQFANKQVLFVAAFTGEVGPVKSNIPFLIANNAPAIAAAYSMPAKDKMNIIIIGKDGNVDYQTSQVIGGERVRDVIQNSYEVQAHTGRQ